MCLRGLAYTQRLPFFIFGMIFREYRERIEKLPLNTLTLGILMVVGLGMEVLERKRFGDCQFYLGSYLIVFAMMVFAIRNQNVKCRILQHTGRDLSMNIYLYHIAVGKTVDVIGKYAHWWGKNPYYVARPFVVLVGTLLFAEGLWQIKRCMINHRTVQK